jgi:hypothetical protein
MVGVGDAEHGEHHAAPIMPRNAAVGDWVTEPFAMSATPHYI